MTQLFYRDGAPVAEKDLPRVVLGKLGQSGFIVHVGPCGRCGGQGGSAHWRPSGGICYRCHGKNSETFEHREVRVFTADKLATLQARDEKKRQVALEKQRKAEEQKRHDLSVWLNEGGPARRALVERIHNAAKGKHDGFIADLARKLLDCITLTDKQIEAAERVLDAVENRERQNAASEWVGDIKERIEIAGRVEFVRDFDGAYGVTTLIKWRDDAGNVCAWFASGCWDVAKGDRIAGKGTVKKHDEYQDTKQTVFTRCKIDIDRTDREGYDDDNL